MANAGVQVRVLGLLAGVNKNLRGQMRNFTCKPALQIDASWPLDVENKAIFKKFADFAKSTYACAVQQQAKKYGHTALYKLEWERVVSSGTRNMRFQILAHEGFETGMQDPAMAAGATERWRFIWLALCAGCEFSENFGDFTFSQWLLITHPDLFDFILRFVENSVLHLANVGERSLNIVHCAAFQVDVSNDCYEAIFSQLQKDLKKDWKTIMEDLRPTVEDTEHETVDPCFVQLEALLKMERVHIDVTMPATKLVEDELMKIWLGAVFCDRMILYIDEIDRKFSGVKYNAVNLASVTCNLPFLHTFVLVATRHEANVENLFRNDCSTEGWNNFHLLAIHANKLLENRDIPIEDFWKLLRDQGASTSDFAEGVNPPELPFHTHMRNRLAKERITRLFFDRLDFFVKENREEDIKEWFITNTVSEEEELAHVDGPELLPGLKISQLIVWKILAGSDDAKECMRRICSKERYRRIFDQELDVINEVFYLPAWAPRDADLQNVHATTAIIELALHMAVRWSKFVIENDPVSGTERVEKCLTFLVNLETHGKYWQTKLTNMGDEDHVPQNAQMLAEELGLPLLANELYTNQDVDDKLERLRGSTVAAPPPYFTIRFDSPPPCYD